MKNLLIILIFDKEIYNTRQSTSWVQLDNDSD